MRGGGGAGGMLETLKKQNNHGCLLLFCDFDRMTQALGPMYVGAVLASIVNMCPRLRMLMAKVVKASIVKVASGLSCACS